MKNTSSKVSILTILVACTYIGTSGCKSASHDSQIKGSSNAQYLSLRDRFLKSNPMKPSDTPTGTWNCKDYYPSGPGKDTSRIQIFGAGASQYQIKSADGGKPSSIGIFHLGTSSELLGVQIFLKQGDSLTTPPSNISDFQSRLASATKSDKVQEAHVMSYRIETTNTGGPIGRHLLVEFSTSKQSATLPKPISPAANEILSAVKDGGEFADGYRECSI